MEIPAILPHAQVDEDHTPSADPPQGQEPMPRHTDRAPNPKPIGLSPLPVSIITLNTQKAGHLSPSLVDITMLLDTHNPDVLLLSDTPRTPHQGALTQTLRNRGYRIHYHRLNAPSPPESLPEARLPRTSTHPGGGAWIAYKKTAPWASLARPLNLPKDCPPSITCAIELPLTTGDKVAFIACYLPQHEAEHTAVCTALTRLTEHFPDHTLILGGDFQGNGTCPSVKDANIGKLPYQPLSGAPHPTFAPQQRPQQATHIDHL